MKVAVAVILYKCGFNESDSIKSIIEYLDNNSVSNEYKLYVYDNSEYEQTESDARFIYIANKSNLMLSDNYNRCLRLCENNAVDWLILLDQDSVLSKEYLDIIFNSELDSGRACYIPKILSKEKKTIAPYSVGFGFRKKYNITEKSKLYSVNSGTILNVEFFIDKIGKFSPNYPLDFLDHWYFNRIHKMGGKVCMLNAEIVHDLSVASGGVVSLPRYLMILTAERKFIYNELGILNRIPYKLNLLRRIFRFKKLQKNDHASLLRDFFFYRKRKIEKHTQTVGSV